jgi:hypothetical protein
MFQKHLVVIELYIVLFKFFPKLFHHKMVLIYLNYTILNSSKPTELIEFKFR